MIKKWFNTPAADIANMVGVSDEKILELSNGEVTKIAWWEDSEEEQKGSLIDLDIFGSYDNPNLLGHIELPYPVVNVQYIYGINPTLPDMLGTDKKTVDFLAYATIVNPKGSANTPEDYKKLVEGEQTVGADLVERLLKKAGKSTDGIILHRIPVIPLCMRARCITDENGEIQHRLYNINTAYTSVVSGVSRIRKLIDIGAPEIILANERRVLQETVDVLINNGARGIPKADYDGIVKDDLLGLYNRINNVSTEPEYICNKGIENIRLDAEKIAKIAKEYKSVCEQERRDNEMYFEKKDALRDELSQCIAPLVNLIKELHFTSYIKGFDAELNDVASHAAIKALDEWKPDKEDIKDRLFLPIYSHLRCYTKKRVMWS